MIILVTLNAKYIHTSLGLRYLYANMGNLKKQTVIREFTVARKPQDIVDELISTLDCKNDVNQEKTRTQILGFGIYVWNVVQTITVIRLLRTIRPDIRIVLGGPEVSHELSKQEIVRLADHVITGWGDVSFAKLCFSLLYGPQPRNKIIAGEQLPLDQIAFPYDEYSDRDLAHRLLYVEASRGCPYKCHFCLSSLDKTAWAFDLESFLAQMHALYRRGARNFKFVDRTFNLKIDAAICILQFFLDRLSESCDKLFVHLEVIPDHLPDRLKHIIAQFPSGVLQFEVGIQSFNADVQQRISRKQDNEKTEANLHWLLTESNAHLHTDLIFALPGETLDSFANGFDRLYAMKPHEIQLGILKRLRGAPIDQHTVEFAMVYDLAPPYTIKETSVIDVVTMERFKRMARYWDLIANSGRFNESLTLLMDCITRGGKDMNDKVHSPFYAFLGFSDWLWASSNKTSEVTPEALVDALFTYLTKELGKPENTARQVLLSDYLASGARAKPDCLRNLLRTRSNPSEQRKKELSSRQKRHISSRQTAKHQ